MLHGLPAARRSARDPDRVLAAIAARQHGAFALAQALDAGLTQAMVERRVRTGRYLRVTRGVYLLAGTPESFRRQLWIASLAVPAGVISGLAGAGLQRFDGFGPCSAELTIVAGANRSVPGVRIRRRTSYRSTRVEGLPVGTVDQLVADLAGAVGLSRLESVVDGLLLDRRTTIGRLEDHVVRMAQGREPGAGDLRLVVAARSEGDPVAESELERRLDALLEAAGAPGWVNQLPVSWGSGRGFVDRFVPAWRLIAEADGRRWHARLADFERDRRRDKEALAAELATARFTHTELPIGFTESVGLLRGIGGRRTWGTVR